MDQRTTDDAQFLKGSIFDKEVKSLLILSNKILSQGKGKQPAIAAHKCLQLYAKGYNELTEPEDHVGGFRDLYKEFQVGIVSGREWLKGKKATVQYPNVKGMTLCLSDIYEHALLQAEDLKSKISATPGLENKLTDEEWQTQVFPDMMYLRLYRILKEVCEDEEDKSSIMTQLTRVETRLKAKEATPSTGSGMGDVLSSLIQNLTKEGGQQKIMDGIANLLSNDQVKDGVGKILGQLMGLAQKADPSGEVLQTVKDTFPAAVKFIGPQGDDAPKSP